ncbi:MULTISPECIES: LytR C-terminal domain-containing protein [unclassified Microbacterium]|uniref:LytR C-terminal domain-containing protein n=1 Tax=unclassified Microbacterium TaxID=2609290 RepID=UPI00386A1A24
MTDRFDDLPASPRRIGAHRAENPRLRLGGVLLWSAIATVVIIFLGVFGSMLASGRLSIAPGGTQQSQGPVAPQVDASYPVLVLNATDQEGLGGEIRELVIGGGWAEGAVQEVNASSDDFAVTTVYYPTPADEAAARGLADVIGGAEVDLDDTYDVVASPSAADAQNGVKPQLVIVVGLDFRTE